jgi:phenylpropionate dioxygenase-like ring-hydroxylating dioxygenase large terminal subunit
MTELDTIDPRTRDEWHVVATLAGLPERRAITTRLLGLPLAIARRGDEVAVWRCGEGFRGGGALDRPPAGGGLPVLKRFGYAWTSLGTPDHDLFAIPEVDEPERLTINACTVAINASAPRAIENFCDMAHFPFVHTGYLGTEARPEVAPYDVELSPDGREIFARHCRFFQPESPDPASGGFDVDYIYRIPHPCCALLYEATAADPERRDVIGIFCQPVTEERVNASLFGAVLRDTMLYGVDLTSYRSFQLLLIGQDKAILENQRPRRLPLDAALEAPTRADLMSIAYRRWLRDRGIAYGTVRSAPRASPAA